MISLVSTRASRIMPTLTVTLHLKTKQHVALVFVCVLFFFATRLGRASIDVVCT